MVRVPRARDPKEADDRLKQFVADGELESEEAEKLRHLLYFVATFGIRQMAHGFLGDRRTEFADATGLELIDYANIPDE